MISLMPISEEKLLQCYFFVSDAKIKMTKHMCVIRYQPHDLKGKVIRTILISVIRNIFIFTIYTNVSDF